MPRDPHEQATAWIEPSPRRASAICRLFCFPYAGGSTAPFSQWSEALPADVEICPVQLPGRGRRIRETPFTRADDLIPALAAQLTPWLDLPFAFFGHSMGAVLAFEISRWLRASHRVQPAHLFVSGSSAPHLREDDPQTYDLPLPEFLEELRRLEGTPDELLRDPEVLALLLPVLRADFELVQTYVYREQPPLHCPITAFGGLADTHATEARVRGWQVHTHGAFETVMGPGGHFFLKTDPQPLLQALAQRLTVLARQCHSVYPALARRGLAPRAADHTQGGLT